MDTLASGLCEACMPNTWCRGWEPPNLWNSSAHGQFTYQLGSLRAFSIDPHREALWDCRTLLQVLRFFVKTWMLACKSLSWWTRHLRSSAFTEANFCRKKLHFLVRWYWFSPVSPVEGIYLPIVFSDVACFPWQIGFLKFWSLQHKFAASTKHIMFWSIEHAFSSSWELQSCGNHQWKDPLAADPIDRNIEDRNQRRQLQALRCYSSFCLIPVWWSILCSGGSGYKTDWLAWFCRYPDCYQGPPI